MMYNIYLGGVPTSVMCYTPAESGMLQLLDAGAFYGVAGIYLPGSEEMCFGKMQFVVIFRPILMVINLMHSDLY